MKTSESTTLKNISLALGIMAILVSAAVSVYAVVYSSTESTKKYTDEQIKEHTQIEKTLADQTYFPKVDGIVIQTKLEEINSKITKIMLTQDEILKEIRKN